MMMMGVKNNGSRYDFVKVRVFLNSERYYVLSRYLLSRMLTSTFPLIQQSHAISIALDLKKYLVDSNRLEISQLELEQVLFGNIVSQLASSNLPYDISEQMALYRMVCEFHHRRIPIIILLAGTYCTGKSNVALMLAEKLNLSSILATDLVYTCGLLSSPHGRCEEREVKDAFQLDADQVQVYLQSHLAKCIAEGKSLIVEGVHVGLRLADFIKSQSASTSKECVLIPILLTVTNSQIHRQMIVSASGMSADTFCDTNSDLDAKAQRYRDIQDYLIQTLPIDTFTRYELASDTVDLMHRHTLDMMRSHYTNHMNS